MHKTFITLNNVTTTSSLYFFSSSSCLLNLCPHTCAFCRLLCAQNRYSKAAKKKGLIKEKGNARRPSEEGGDKGKKGRGGPRAVGKGGGGYKVIRENKGG